MEHLPLPPGTAEVTYPHVRAVQVGPWAEKKRILIVDDDPLFRRFLIAMLAHTGWSFADIREAEDSATALEICRTESVDLIFCDLNLPTDNSVNGLEIIAELRQFRPDTPVFMVTADSSEILMLKICALGATGHLLKPVKLRSLQRALMLSFADNPESCSR
jgi:CheY-like chemotaxis protein